MTLKQREYIKRQINTIATKKTEDELNRYTALLGAAKLDDEVRGWLTRAVDVRREEITAAIPMVENGDMDDIFE